MNLTSSLLAVGLMTVGATSTIYFLSDPPVAMSRLSAQAQADSIVERLQIQARRGKRFMLETDPTTGKLVGKLDGTAITVPDECTFLDRYNGKPGFFLQCTDALASRDPKAASARVGVARLIGADPCDSDLFPMPTAPTATANQLYLCQESATTKEPPPGGLANGEFDLDSYCTAAQSNPWTPAKGRHTHRWDDKTLRSSFDLVSAQSMDGLLSTSLPPNAIGENCVSSTDNFAIVVVNGGLSPGARISITSRNSSGTTSTSSCSLTTYRRDCTGAEGAFPLYTLGPATSSVNQLTSLVISFDSDTMAKAKVIPTSTGLVNASLPTPGKNCEWRNGAAVIQIVRQVGSTALTTTQLVRSDRSPSFYNLSTRANASACNTTGTARIYTSNGGSGLAVNNVLYEMSVFVHLPGAKYIAGSTYYNTPGTPSNEYCKMASQYVGQTVC